jgi:hypothetical protein
MTFLHGEFFYWMLPLIAILFYFWQTQKSPQSAPFSEFILKRLHAPEITMTLWGRNTLFLIAAVLLIAAMAQPVIFQDEAATDGKVNILIALDLSKKSPDAFEAEKRSAIDTLRLLRGENISLVGYDTHVFRISPYSTDTDILVSLIQGLDIDMIQRFESDSSVIGSLQTNSGMKIIIGDPIYERNTQLTDVTQTLERIKKSQRLYAHIPLFYYPLGLAMLLILIALSSMSKRRSVPLAAILLMVYVNEIPSSAGILDFRVLDTGYRAYERGDYSQSIASFKAYQKVHDTPEIRYNLANALYKNGAYQQALYWYQQVYSTDPLLLQRTAYNLRLCKQRIATKGNTLKKSIGYSDDFQEVLVSKQEKQTAVQVKTRLYSM